MPLQIRGRTREILVNNVAVSIVTYVYYHRLAVSHHIGFVNSSIGTTPVSYRKIAVATFHQAHVAAVRDERTENVIAITGYCLVIIFSSNYVFLVAVKPYIPAPTAKFRLHPIQQKQEAM